jgi:ElaB/YqjD/DUF883 family membrane-anchored ribosome-binding protein
MSGTRFQTVANLESDAEALVGKAAHAAGEVIRDASSQASEAGARLRRESSQLLAEMSREVSAQPVQSVLIAAGAGLLAGLLLARR